MMVLPGWTSVFIGGDPRGKTKGDPIGLIHSVAVRIVTEGLWMDEPDASVLSSHMSI